MPNYRLAAVRAAKKYGIDPGIFLRQINQESGFNPNARSSAGAVGIAQFMPATARGFGIDPTDPMQALDAAARMDAGNLKKYGSYARMLSAYNSGRADAYKDPHFAGGQTYNYVRSILRGQTPAVGAPQAAPAAPGGPSGVQATVQSLPQAAGLTSLLSGLNSLAAGGGSKSGGWGMDMLANTVNQIHAMRSYQQSASQYGDQTVPTKLSNGQIMTGVNPNSPHDLGAVKLAESFIGTPYKWGGSRPGGFDCSGLLQYVWGKEGVGIPRTTYQQFAAGRPVGPNQLQPGDAVFFKGSDSMVQGGRVLPGHVGMYIGGGKFIEAPHTGSTVHISTLAGRTDYMGARRFA